jgi:pSer/pThr/pTyr-binding forkhead associated (FHA) protein
MAGQPTPRPSPAAAANGAPTLTPLGHYAGRPNIPISRTVTLVGSRHDARLHLHSSTVSKAHCLIVNTASGAYVRDLASRTKVIVNGKPERETDLHDGDKLQIGKFEFRFNPGVNLRTGAPKRFDPAPPASLRVEGEAMPLPIESRVTLIGRRATCDVPLTEASVSTAHAVIYEMNGKRMLRDLGSRTGTFVNGRPIHQDVELSFGDELRIGETEITYAPAAAGAGETDVDDLLAPAAGAIAVDEDPLADLASAVGGREDAGDEPQFELASERAGDAGEHVAADEERDPRAEMPPEPPPAARPSAEAPADTEMSAIDEELGLVSKLDARRGWRPRSEEKVEFPQADVPAEHEIEAKSDAEVAAAAETENAVEETAAEEPAEAGAPPAADQDEASLDLVFDTEAQFGDEIAEGETSDDSTAERTLPGAAELAGLSRTEAPLEEPDEREALQAQSPLALTDAPDAAAGENEDVHDEVPAGPAALDELPREDEAEIELGELPSLTLDESPRGEDSDAVHASTDAMGVDPLDLGPLPADTLELPDDAQVGTSEPLDATLELAIPLEEPPEAPAPEPTPEPFDAPLRPARKRRRSGAKKKGKQRLDLSLDESVVSETIPPAPAEAEPVRAEHAEAERAEADRAEAERAEAGHVEVFDRTQPTPESAQSLEDAVADMLAESPEQAPVISSELSDTAFGRNVEAFAGESSGPLIEAHDEPPAEPADVSRPSDAVPIAVDGSDDDSLHDTPFAVEEPAAVGREGDTAGQMSEAAAGFADKAHALQDAPTIDETPEDVAPVAPLHLQTTDAPAEKGVADENAAGEERAAKTVTPIDPSAPTPQRDRPLPTVDLTGWGPNQEHFLGGMPLRLEESAARSGKAPPQGKPTRPAAEAPRGTPPRPQKSGPKRTPFDVTSRDVPAEDVGSTIPPYSGTNARKGRVTTGFDGLAMPPVRQADVFSQMATPASFVNGILGGSDDVFGGKPGAMPPAGASRAGEPVAQRSGGGGRDHDTPALEEQEPWPQDDAPASEAIEPATRRGRQAARSQLPPTIPPTAAEAYPAPPRKRRWFGLRGLLLLMLLCMTAAVAGIYAFVPSRAIVQGSLAFRNFASLNEMEQRQLKSRQQQLLSLPSLRENARTILYTSDPAAKSGFLDDVAAFSKSVADVKWNSDTMVLRVNGTSPRHDQAAVHAVLTALYQANGDLIEEARKLRSRVDALTDAHSGAQQRVAELKTAIDRTREAAERRPEPVEIAAIEEEAAQLETVWSEAVANVKNIEIDLKRMRDGLSAEPQPAGTAAVPVVDPQLAGLQKKLEDINGQIAQMQQARSAGAEDARRQVEAALAAFEKEVADASAAAQAVPAGPELSAYLAEAQRLQHSTRELTDTLMRRQQEQTEKLTELKARLNEKRDARRDELIQKDPQLKQWSDELSIAQRQHSAAVSAGLKNDADEYAAHVQTLNRMIAARQALIGDDTFYADAITELENIIADTSRSLEADRQSTEAALERMQQTFTGSAPSAAQLPAEQRALAGQLSERLAAVTAARKAYAQAVGSPGNDEQLQKLRDEAAALKADLSQRKGQLAAASEKTQLAAQEQDRIAVIKQRETELATARQAEDKAQAAWAASEKKLREVQARIVDARDAGETLDRLTAERDAAQAELELNLRTLEAARAQLAKKVDPLPPDEKDVRVEPGSNVRPTYSLIAVGGIAAVFTVLILLTAQSDRSAAARATGEDESSEPTGLLLPRADGDGVNGNGHADSHTTPHQREDEPSVPV